MNACADSELNRRSKRMRSSRCTPSPSSTVNFSRKLISRGGACTGAKYSRGSGSNTITVAGSSSARARQQVGDHGLVTTVHAVEGADGDHAATVAVAQVVQPPDQFQYTAPVPGRESSARL